MNQVVFVAVVVWCTTLSFAAQVAKGSQMPPSSFFLRSTTYLLELMTLLGLLMVEIHVDDLNNSAKSSSSYLSV